MLKMMLFAALIGGVLVGISITGVDVLIDNRAITRNSITDFFYFPMPTLPSAKVLDNMVPVGSWQSSKYETTLVGGHNLIAVKHDPFYGEVTLFYATPSVQQMITNGDSIQEVVSKGAIVLDYEKAHNLQSRYADKKPLDLLHNRHIIKSYSQLQASTLFIVPVNKHLKIKIKYVFIKILIVHKVYCLQPITSIPSIPA